MSSEDIAQLPLKEKIEYLGAIFHKCQTQKNLDDIYSENKEQLKSLLYNIQYPKEFFQKEEQLANRFISLVSKNSQITNNMKNWKDLSLEDKKETIKETAKIIEYAYGTSLNIDFYTPEEYRKENNLNEDAHVPGAEHDSSTGKISFNIERLNSDNYMGISVLFHEAMRLCTNDKEKLTLVPRQSINYLNYLICYIWLLLQNIVQLTKIELYLAVYIIYIFRFSRFVFYIGNSMTYSD